MRAGLVVVAALVAWLGIPSMAQAPSHPMGPLGGLLHPHGHGRPPEVAPQSTPKITFDAGSLGSSVLLDKDWRVGVTGDENAAKPDYDDSKWSVRDAGEAIADVPDEDHGPDGDEGVPEKKRGGPHRRPFVYFRIHIKLAPNHGPISLLIELPVSQTASMSIGTQGPAVEVFSDGRPITPDGPHADAPQHYQQISRVYDLNVPQSQTEFVLAIRSIYIPVGMGSYTSFFSNRSLRIGDPQELRRSLELWTTHNLFERLPRLLNSSVLVLLAVFLLALYFTQQKGHSEYFWLALHELSTAPIGYIDMAGGSAYLDQLWYVALVLQLIAISAYFYFEFLVSFLALKRRWYILWLRYTAPVLALVGPVLLMVGHGSFIAVILILVYIGGILWFGGWMLFSLITLINATIRRNFEAGLLLIPLVLSFVGILEPIFNSGMSSFDGRPHYSPLTIQAGPIPIHFSSIADFTGLLAIVLIIFVRFLRIQRDQERASSELAAARSVQELMIPHEKLVTPGFEVDSIYNPANEVGGDFYHVESTEGGMLVVIGDVAGKGLQAAMNVSMLVGALRRTRDKSPARILESLNRVLVGSESFTTCQAVWFGINGELVLANAGHLAPYLNSQEVSLPGGLPLGVIPENTYEEVRLYLHPGDRLLMMSDGVVEARQPSGELFGFARVHNLSNQSAFYIADAAKAFGQEDDITVLTVRRLAQAIAA